MVQLNKNNIISSCLAAVQGEVNNPAATSTLVSITADDKTSLLLNLETALNSKINQDFGDSVLNMAENSLDNQMKIKENQRRMNELADYKYKKTLAYKNIMKRIVYTCIIIIVITYAMKLPFFPSLLGKGIIIIMIAFNIYYLIVDFAWNFRRDNKYWDKFDQFASETLDADGNITLSKYEHNRRSLEKLVPTVAETNTCATEINKVRNQMLIQFDEKNQEGVSATVNT